MRGRTLEDQLREARAAIESLDYDNKKLRLQSRLRSRPGLTFLYSVPKNLLPFSAAFRSGVESGYRGWAEERNPYDRQVYRDAFAAGREYGREMYARDLGQAMRETFNLTPADRPKAARQGDTRRVLLLRITGNGEEQEQTLHANEEIARAWAAEFARNQWQIDLRREQPVESILEEFYGSESATGYDFTTEWLAIHDSEPEPRR